MTAESTKAATIRSSALRSPCLIPLSIASPARYGGASPARRRDEQGDEHHHHPPPVGPQEAEQPAQLPVRCARPGSAATVPDSRVPIRRPAGSPDPRSPRRRRTLRLRISSYGPRVVAPVVAVAHSRAISSRRSRSRCRNTESSMPVLGDLRVQRAALEQLVVRAAVDDPPAVHHHDLVGERDRRHPVGDDERRPARHRLAQAALDRRLGRARRPTRSRRRGSGSAGRPAAPARSRPAGAGHPRASGRARRPASRSRRGGAR